MRAVSDAYEAGIWNDIKVFRDALLLNLAPNERVEADDGYIGEHPQHIKCPAGFCNEVDNKAMQSRVRSRQETINKRFKDFAAMNTAWRHAIMDHGDAFRAIAVVLQLAINQGEKLFECSYEDS